MDDVNVAEHPGGVLDSVERLRVSARARVRGAWFPLLVFGMITLASISLYRRPFAYPRGNASFSAGPFAAPYYAGLPGARSQLGAYLFWLVVAPLGYFACAAWYRRRARHLGVSFRWERWVAAGLGLFALLQALLAMPLYEPGRRMGNMVESGRPSAAVALRTEAAAFLSPLVAVAVGLLVLAWIERRWVVAVVGVLYGGFTVVVNTYGLGQIPPWIARPYGATKDLFIAPAHNLILLGFMLLAASALCAVRDRYAATTR